MKKRMIVILLTVTMTLLMTACGSIDNSNVDVSEEYVVSEVPETTILNTEEIVAEVTEIETETSTEEPFIFTIEYGMSKIDRLFEAHEVLLSQDKTLEDHVQYDTECLDTSCFDVVVETTADGLSYQIGGAIYTTAIDYYNHYVNENGEYYDFEEWLSKQENSQVLKDKYFSRDDSSDTNNVLLLEAIGVIAYMKSCESIEPVELIETTDYLISGIPSAYAIPLNCDGDTGLTSVFDAEGNLLNICTEDNWNNYVTSFPDGDKGNN